MKICVIGGIGTGKSTFIDVAKDLGIKCLSADEINANLLETPSYIEKVKSVFPNVIENEKVNKKALADIVFNNEQERIKLNGIAHPAIMNEIYNSKEDPLVVELPLFLESNSDDYFDSIVLIHTPILKRINRLKTRGLTFIESYKRISSQVKEKELKRVCTKVIDNSGTLEDFKEKVKKYLEVLISTEKED